MQPMEQALLRRHLLGTLGAAFGTGVLAACGAPGAQPPAEREPTQPVTLEYWPHWSSTPPNDARYTKLAGAFSAEHANITINTTSYGHNLEKLISAIVAGTPPDVAIIRSSGQSLALKGAVQALDDRIARAKYFKKGDYADAQWDQYIWKGKIYAVPSMENGSRGALAYNRKLIAESGLNPGQPPKSTDDLQRMHERLTKEEGGQLKQLGFDPWAAMSLEGFLEMWGAGYGARWYDATQVKLNLNTTEMLEAVEAFTAFRIRTGWDKVVAHRATYGAWTGRQDGFTQGVDVMQINGYWTPGSLRVNAPQDSDLPQNIEYTWIPTKRGTEKVQLIGGWAAAMPAGVKQPDAAWRWMDWLTSATANQILLDEFGFLNGNRTVIKELKYENTPGLKFYLDSLSQADKVVPPINLPIWAELDRGYRTGLDEVGQGKKSARVMLDDLQTLMQQLLDQVVMGGS
ncbi:MAG TPA: extracellular solute-binding protein [Chloroflexota bacterium]|nr:extracellular solute-binding protein [Chloroflexota bacterium]